MHRLLTDLNHRLARQALTRVAHLLREEEHRDAFDEFYAAFRDELLRYEVQRERMRQRLGRSEPDPSPDRGGG